MTSQQVGIVFVMATILIPPAGRLADQRPERGIHHVLGE